MPQKVRYFLQTQIRVVVVLQFGFKPTPSVVNDVEQSGNLCALCEVQRRQRIGHINKTRRLVLKLKITLVWRSRQFFLHVVLQVEIRKQLANRHGLNSENSSFNAKVRASASHSFGEGRDVPVARREQHQTMRQHL